MLLGRQFESHIAAHSNLWLKQPNTHNNRSRVYRHPRFVWYKKIVSQIRPLYSNIHLARLQLGFKLEWEGIDETSRYACVLSWKLHISFIIVGTIRERHIVHNTSTTVLINAPCVRCFSSVENILSKLWWIMCFMLLW